MSAVLGDPKTTVCPTVPLIDPGQTIVGGVVSTMVIVPESVAVNPPLSVAVQSTLVAPSGSTDPMGGTHVTVGVPSSASDAVPIAANERAQPPVVFASFSVSATLMVGAVLAT